jgi:hypothetical protein
VAPRQRTPTLGQVPEHETLSQRRVAHDINTNGAWTQQDCDPPRRIQGAQPPCELRPGTGGRGPAELLERFDSAVVALNHAITGTNVIVVARAFAELASAAGGLADAV